jgi:hypothetical protein
MRLREFLTEWIIKKRYGDVVLLVSEHVQDQARDRGIPWTYIERMLADIGQMNPEKLAQMLNFDQFYIRDNELWTELGCKAKTDGEVLSVYVNTVIRREPGVGRSRNVPTLQVN